MDCLKEYGLRKLCECCGVFLLRLFVFGNIISIVLVSAAINDESTLVPIFALTLAINVMVLLIPGFMFFLCQKSRSETNSCLVCLVFVAMSIVLCMPIVQVVFCVKHIVAHGCSEYGFCNRTIPLLCFGVLAFLYTMYIVRNITKDVGSFFRIWLRDKTDKCKRRRYKSGPNINELEYIQTVSGNIGRQPPPYGETNPYLPWEDTGPRDTIQPQCVVSNVIKKPQPLAPNATKKPQHGVSNIVKEPRCGESKVLEECAHVATNFRLKRLNENIPHNEKSHKYRHTTLRELYMSSNGSAENQLEKNNGHQNPECRSRPQDFEGRPYNNLKTESRGRHGKISYDYWKHLKGDRI